MSLKDSSNSKVGDVEALVVLAVLEVAAAVVSVLEAVASLVAVVAVLVVVDTLHCIADLYAHS